MDDDRLINRDLIWAPGTDELTSAQMDAIRMRDNYAARPIPSKTALGYDHLMADADRSALLAENDRLHEKLAATQEFAERCTAERDQYRAWRDEAWDELENHRDNALTAAFALADITKAAMAERDELRARLAGSGADNH
jgi:hypothetical protein